MHFYSVCRLKRQISLKGYLAALASPVFPIHVALLFTLVILLSISIVITATAQSPAKASSTSEPIIRVFLPSAIEALENENSSNALEYLHAIDQELSSFPDQNMSITWIHTVQLLVQDAIEEVRNGNGSNALTYLSLASERLGVPLPISGDQGLAEKTESDNFLTYDNPTLDLKIQYPSNWSVVEYPYNPTGNNTIVGFFSDEKTSSELGNLSGVSGSFVPYLDIFSFDSKNMSLDTIFNGIVHNFRNNSNFSINQSGSFALSGNQSANMIVYDARVGGDELFRKIQAYTLYNNRVYVISFTSQQSLFENYLPIVQKMISSFIVR